MKEKYKDQDEEDRRLSMLVLQVLSFALNFILSTVLSKLIYLI